MPAGRVRLTPTTSRSLGAAGYHIVRSQNAVWQEHPLTLTLACSGKQQTVDVAVERGSWRRDVSFSFASCPRTRKAIKLRVSLFDAFLCV